MSTLQFEKSGKKRNYRQTFENAMITDPTMQKTSEKPMAFMENAK